MNSKRKGTEFEHSVVWMIRRALDLEPVEIYRTPMSGAHFALGRGVDIQIATSRALERFPFAVECKHVRTWRPDAMARKELRSQEAAWAAQVLKAASAYDLTPLLILSGNGTGIWAATWEEPRLISICPRICFYHADRVWVMTLFQDFLNSIRKV